MEWVRSHIILKTKHFEYGIRGNEKSFSLAGVDITLQAKTTGKKSRTVQPGFQREPSAKVLEILNGSTFVQNNLKLN